MIKGLRIRRGQPREQWQLDQDERNRELGKLHKRRLAALVRQRRQRAQQGRKDARARRRAERDGQAPAPASGVLGVFRAAALAGVSLLVSAATLTSFAESYRALYDWAREHGLPGFWAAAWPLQVDTFIAVGELALFVALADGWRWRSRLGAWLVTLAGLAASVAGNVGHVHSHMLTDRGTAAIPPLAAAAALAVGLGVLKRVVAHRTALGASGADDEDEEPPHSNGLPPYLAEAQRRYAEEIATGALPGYRRIRSEMKVGGDRATEILAHLRALAEP